MQSLAKITLIVSLLVLMGSCRESVQFPIIPAIEYKDFVIFPDSAHVVMDITDGDGNFGLNPEDTLGNFEYSIDPFNKYHFCIFLEPYVLVNNQWELIDFTPSPANPNALPFFYRTKERLDRTGTDKNLEAEIKVLLFPWPPTELNSGDTIRFEAHVADRDLNESNRIETPAYIIP